MPEGPFGLPRITTLGPLVEEKGPNEIMFEIARRSHSYRNYDPREFIKILDSGEIPQHKVRQELRIIESRRFNDALAELHNFWFALDEDEMEMFAERNPGIIQWVEVWARAEDQIAPSESIGEVL